jgi:hypothetical protein
MLTGSPAYSGAVQRAQRAGLSMLLGRLAKPGHKPTERAIRKVYRLRLPERGATARTNADNWMHRIIRAAVNARIGGLPLGHLTLSAQAVNG